MQSNNYHTDNLIWIDLEMTGVNPDQDHILEIAMMITDRDLNIIADDFNLIIHQPIENLSNMNNFVRNLHTDNGLLKLVSDSNIDLATAENLALEFVNKYIPENCSPMCGNSICLDRRFLFKFMPNLEKHFHYRNLDVSTIKNLGIYWFPKIVSKFKKPDGLHRAKEDLFDSINELKFYRNNLFVT